MAAVNDLESAVDAWLREYAATSLAADEVDRVTALLNEQIARDVPAIGRDAELREALDASTHAQLRAFLTYLLNPGEMRPPAEAFQLARLMASHGVELAELLAVYRNGQQAALRYVTEVAREAGLDPEVTTAALVRVWGQAIDWFSRTVELLIGAFGEERENWLREALTQRSRIVERILAEDPVDVDQATTQLSHSLRRHQLALVLWLGGGTGTESTALLESAAQRLARAVGAPRPLVVPAGPGTSWAWLTPDRRVRLAERMVAAELPAGVRVAAGTVAAPGLAGFRDTHREALAAYGLADLLPEQLLDYGELELVSMLAQDRRALRAFVARELGDLGADDPATAKLRATVLAQFDGGVDAAATSLGVHRNTVRYRLNQAQELLGRPLTERRRELELALLLAATLAV